MKMKRQIISAVLLVTLLAFIAACGVSQSATPTTTTVTMGATSFDTSSVTISKGSAITFTTSQGGTAHNLINGSSGHLQAEQGVPDFGAGGQTVGAGQSWTTGPWNIAGTFHVTCTYHPTTMTLTVIVTG